MTIAVLMNADGSAGYVPAMDLAKLAYGRDLPPARGLSLDALDRTQGVYRDAKGEEATVALAGGVATLMRSGKADQTLETAGGLKFQGGGTVAAFSVRPDGLYDLRLRLNGREDVRLARVMESLPLGSYEGVYGRGAGGGMRSGASGMR